MSIGGICPSVAFILNTSTKAYPKQMAIFSLLEIHQFMTINDKSETKFENLFIFTMTGFVENFKCSVIVKL